MRRRPVNKKRAVRSFNKDVKTAKVINVSAPRRGGIRL